MTESETFQVLCIFNTNDENVGVCARIMSHCDWYKIVDYVDNNQNRYIPLSYGVPVASNTPIKFKDLITLTKVIDDKEKIDAFKKVFDEHFRSGDKDVWSCIEYDMEHAIDLQDDEDSLSSVSSISSGEVDELFNSVNLDLED
jgi:hypothetical protein